MSIPFLFAAALAECSLLTLSQAEFFFKIKNIESRIEI